MLKGVALSRADAVKLLYITATFALWFAGMLLSVSKTFDMCWVCGSKVNFIISGCICTLSADICMPPIFCDHTNARLRRQSPIYTASMQIPEIASARCSSVCKPENQFVAQDQGWPAALRFCFHLLGCLRVVDPLAVTYLKSVPNEHRHRKESAALFPHSSYSVFFHLLFDFTERRKRWSGSFLLSLLLIFFFSLLLLCITSCVERSLRISEHKEWILNCGCLK